MEEQHEELLLKIGEASAKIQEGWRTLAQLRDLLGRCADDPLGNTSEDGSDARVQQKNIDMPEWLSSAEREIASKPAGSSP
eukprot:scaffold298997_cov35-Tisochrysis_lutea.AAC.2